MGERTSSLRGPGFRSLLVLFAALAVAGAWFLHRQQAEPPRAPRTARTEEIDAAARETSAPRAIDPVREPRTSTPESAERPEGPGASGTNDAPRDESAAGTLRVVVIDADGARCEGARVSVPLRVGGELSHVAGTTDSAGECVLPDLPVSVNAIGVSVGTYSRTVFVALVPGASTDKTVIMPRPGGRIAGQVVHALRGPLEGVVVVTSRRREDMEDDLRTVTDRNGQYALEPVPAGTYSITLHLGGSAAALCDFATVKVKENETVLRDFEVGGATLRGTLRDTETHRPVAGATVRIVSPVRGPRAERNTGPLGDFRFDDLTRGPYVLAFEKQGYANIRRKLDLDVPDKVLDVVLDRPAFVHIHVEDTDGRPVAGDAEIVWSREDGDTAGSTTLSLDRTGSAACRAIAPGTYRLTAHRWGDQQGFASRPVKAVIGAGESTVRFVVPRRETAGSRSIFGTVRDAVSDAPLAGVHVEVGGFASTTDEHGAYAIRRCPPGTYSLLVWKDGYGDIHSSGVVVDKEERQMDVTMEPASVLLLRLRDVSGGPVGGEVDLFYVTEANGVRTGAGASFSADAAGRARFARLSPGRYRLTLNVAGRGGAVIETTITQGENVVDVDLRDGLR